MQTLLEGNVVVVALVAGEEIIECLGQVAAAHRIRGGSFTGLGSTSAVELGFFDPEKKEYVPRSFEEPMEIGSLVGNFSVLDGEVHVHAHATVCGRELIAFTGHLHRGVVGTACEIYIQVLPRKVLREKDPAAGFAPLKIQ